jgi:hypothetical protein
VLSEGVHHIWVHVKDDLGTGGTWGPALDLPLVIDKTGPTTIAATTSPSATNGIQADPSNPGYVRLSAEITDGAPLASNLIDAEAFLGAVKADGSGLQLIPVDGRIDSPSEKFYALIPLSQLKAYPNGPVAVFVHGQDAAGNWGTATLNAASLLIDRVAPKLAGLSGALGAPGARGVSLTSALTELNSVTAAEVWTTAKDPGVGKATPVTQTTGAGTITAAASLPAPSGPFTYHLRVRDGAGNWSNAVTTTVTAFTSLFEQNLGREWKSTSGSVSTSANAVLGNVDEPAPNTKGLQVNPAGSVVDTGPAAALSYHSRFQLQTAQLGIGSGTAALFVARSTDGGGNEVFGLRYRTSTGAPQLGISIGGAAITWVPLPAGQHTIGLDWAGGSTARLMLTVDSTTTTITGTSPSKIESVQLGVVPSGGTVTGRTYFDTFLSVSSASA